MSEDLMDVKFFRVVKVVMPKYKICWSCIILFLAIWIMTWSLMSCFSKDFDEMKEIPVPEEGTSMGRFISKKDLSTHFVAKKSFNWKSMKTPSDVKFTFFDSRYESVDYFFFLKFNNWFKKLQFENGFLPIDQKENLDCDNFAMLYKSLMSVSSYKGKSEFEPAVALVVVEQKNPFGGVPKGYLHMVNLVFTNKGWYIFEPQTGKFTLLEDYSNQEYLKYIIL
jgi:hypothetical protein|tara:strand:- start:1702 stop:2370 length:669 start_codon:yes stop_codon:yes gene_type:complete